MSKEEQWEALGVVGYGLGVIGAGIGIGLAASGVAQGMARSA